MTGIMMLDTPAKPNPTTHKKPTSSSKKFQSIAQSSSTLIDISYNHYGRRIATCSSDKTVQIWDYMDTTDEWVSSDHSLLQTSECVTRICWCHPLYGQLIATCSNTIVCIWQEKGGALTTSMKLSPWDKKVTLADARLPVHCIQFAPYHLGLKLATGSADGIVRIYEAADLRDYTNWSLHSSLDVKSKEVTCLSWCSTQFEPPTVVIGTSNGVFVYRYNDSSRDWFLALSLSNTISISDVSWATKLTRKYHTIASINDTGILTVYRIKCDKESDNPFALCLESSQVLNEEVGNVTEYRKRCGWNTTGEILASSGDECVQLWKESLNHEWRCVSKVYENYMEYQF